jgi:hypothetical protein
MDEMNSRIVSCLLASGLAALPMKSNAVNLHDIGESSDEIVSVDVDNIKKIGLNVEANISLFYRQTKNVPNVGAVRMELTRFSFGCYDQTVSVLRNSYFGGATANLLAKIDYPPEPVRIQPGSETEAIWKYTCTEGWERDGQ